MAADSTLVQSGKNLYDAQYDRADAGAFAEGKKLINDQIEKNIKNDREAQEWEHKIDKLENEKFLRGEAEKTRLQMKSAEKGAYFDYIEQGIERGFLDDSVYSTFNADREAWWKDQANQLKAYEDIGDKTAFKDRLAKATAAEDNWPNVIDWSANATISDTDQEAQRIDLAIEGWAKNNPGKSPKIITKNGKDYFEIPDASLNGEMVHIAVDKIAGAEDGNVVGSYNKPVVMESVQADFTNLDIYDNFKLGKASSADFGELDRFISEKISNPTAAKELLSGLFISTGFDAGKYGITDTSGPNGEPDGQITYEDLDTDPNTPGVQLDEQLAQTMIKEVLLADMPERQIGDEVIANTQDAVIKESKGLKGKDETFQDRLNGSFNENNEFNPQSLVGLKIGNTQIGGVGKDDSGNWTIKSSNGKETIFLGPNPTKESIASALGYELETPEVVEIPDDEFDNIVGDDVPGGNDDNADPIDDETPNPVDEVIEAPVAEENIVSPGTEGVDYGNLDYGQGVDTRGISGYPPAMGFEKLQSKLDESVEKYGFDSPRSQKLAKQLKEKKQKLYDNTVGVTKKYEKAIGEIETKISKLQEDIAILEGKGQKSAAGKLKQKVKSLQTYGNNGKNGLFALQRKLKNHNSTYSYSEQTESETEVE